MLLYRARVEGPIAQVVSLAAGPVRCRPGLGTGPGTARITLRYARSPGGEVRCHRGWLHTSLPAGTRLEGVGCQVDGAELLLSLRPVRPVRAGAERLEERFGLPFHLPGRGEGALEGCRTRLRLSCRPREGALLITGRLTIRGEGPGGPLRLDLPFARLVAAGANRGLRWTAAGELLQLTCRREPGGLLAGEAVLALTCLGRPEAGAPADAAAVREVSATAGELSASFLQDGRALVEGRVALEAAWSDRSGRGRWTGREVPFSAVLSLPGLCRGDRLEPVARVERISRAGEGEGARAVLLLGVGLTALRTVHLPLEGDWYRVERVVGQAVTSLTLDRPLFRSDPGAAVPLGARAATEQTRSSLPLPAPLRAAHGLELVGGGGAWEARLLLRLRDGLRLVAADLTLPDGGRAAGWQPVWATALGATPDQMEMTVGWRRTE
ncbi:MAG: hypothetical protein ACOY93_22470 [Bacillota bacterium]